MKRGARAAELPEGIRQDTRKHTRHVLRPPAELVAAYLAAPSEGEWARFETGYRAAVEARLEQDPRALDALVALARERDVFLGCSCPTAKNPCLRRCHTWLALELLQARHPELEVRMPDCRCARCAP